MADPVRRWANVAQQAEQRYGIPANVLLGLVKIESGGTEGRTSGAGAQGLTQFMPGTARSIGVDVRPGHARSQIFGAAKYLKQLGFQKNPRLALSSYNAGPGNPGAAGPYASNVLAAAAQYKGVRGSGGGSGASQGGSVDPGAGSQTTTAPPDLGAAQSMLPLLQALQSQSQPRPSAGIQAPAFSAQAALPGGYQGVVSGGGPAPKADMSALLSAVQTVGGNVPQTQVPVASGAAAGDLGASPAGHGAGASAAVGWARSKVGAPGSQETGPNQGGLASFLNKRFGMSGQPWCAMFTSAAVTKGGAPASARTASVAQVRQKAQQGVGYQRGYVNPNQAQQGDLILFGNSHIGMVESVDGGRIRYVGGNQSNGVHEAVVPARGASIVRPKYGAR